MSTLSVGTIKSIDALPPVIQNTSGTQIGTFCRAWVNFNGTGTVAIRAAFNVSSITDNGTGTYTINITTAMPDINYAVCGSCSPETGTIQVGLKIDYSRVLNASVAPTVSAFTVSATNDGNGLAYDTPYVNISVFR